VKVISWVTLTLRWAFGNDEIVEECKVCHTNVESSWESCKGARMPNVM